jgi:hypothetical protein
MAQALQTNELTGGKQLVIGAHADQRALSGDE